MKKSDKELLLKIQKYCLDIQQLIGDIDVDAFKKQASYEKQYACSFCLFQIGELANKLSPDFKLASSGFNWKGAYGLRNIIGHDYDGISVSSVWRACQSATKNLLPYIAGLLCGDSKTL
ncbi:MAG: DUF86 domain-containing protein [Defluviitaleaceae bacterium]|nr:DUF86 domain-containing protein [Defluviitaleaceae bacterium]